MAEGIYYNPKYVTAAQAQAIERGENVVVESEDVNITRSTVLGSLMWKGLAVPRYSARTITPNIDYKDCRGCGAPRRGTECEYCKRRF